MTEFPTNDIWTVVIWPNVHHITILVITETQINDVWTYLRCPTGRGLRMYSDAVLNIIIKCALERIEFKGHRPFFDGTNIFLNRGS